MIPLRTIRLAIVPAMLLATLPARAAEAPEETFPVPARLAEAVSFWQRVWSEWSMGEIVLHDTLHPSLVYEIFPLPGTVEESYTEPQKEFVRTRREGLAARLEALEAKVVAGEELSDDEKALALRVTQTAGIDALAGAHERVRSQRGLKERFLRGVSVSGRYVPEFKRIFREAGLPEDLAYLPHVESSFQANARSAVGALGMWQFMRGTGRKFLRIDAAVDERLDPVAAARGAARYLSLAHGELESWPLAVTSYNHGIGGMRRAKERFGTDFEAIVSDFDGKYFGFASRNFYASFVAALRCAKAIEAEPPEGFAPEPPLELDRISLDRPATAAALAKRYGVPAAKLAAINRSWTARAVRHGAPIPAGVEVWLPEGTVSRVAAAEAAKVHVVVSGESLSRIASLYRVTLSELLERNELRATAVIRPGDVLRIP